LDSAFSERAYGANSFSDFVDKLRKAEFVNVSGTGGRYLIERKGSATPEIGKPKPEELLPLLRDVLETHRMEIEDGCLADELDTWMREEHPSTSVKNYGFQEFAEFLNFAQDKLVVRIEPDEEKGLMVFLGAEFYPPAPPPQEEPAMPEEEDDGPQPIVEGQPSMVAPTPPITPKPVKRAPKPRKRAASPSDGERPKRRAPRKKATD
jgi:hypothetical protein